MFKRILTLILITITFSLISCTSGGGNTTPSNPPAPIAPKMVSMTVSPTTSTINLIGGSQQFTATATYSDGTKQNVSELATWSSDNESIAIVSNDQGKHGFATPKVAGSVNITATFKGLSSSGKLIITSNISLESIEVTPLTITAPIGVQKSFKAYGHYSDSSTIDITNTVSWNSSSPNVASITPNGIATTLNSGSTTIRASLNSISGYATLTVSAAELDSIDISPKNESVSLGTQEQFVAMGTYSDKSIVNITTNVTWNSSNESVATINKFGVVTTVSAGNTTITAALGNISKSTTFSVTHDSLTKITISPINQSINIGNSVAYTATGTYEPSGDTHDITNQVSWLSSKPSIAQINSNGIATGIASGGPITITASKGNINGTGQLTVESSTKSLPGWPNYLAMGSISGGDIYGGSESPTKIDSVFSYNGMSGGGDPGHIENPYKIFGMIAMARNLESKYHMNTVNPALVEYQWQLSGGWDTQDVTDDDRLTLHLFNLMFLAQTLQNNTSGTGTHGTILLNPDLLGFIGNMGRENDAAALNIHIKSSINRAYCMITKTANFSKTCTYSWQPLPVEITNGTAADLITYLRSKTDNAGAGGSFVSCMESTLYEQCKTATVEPSIPTFEDNFNGWIQAQNWIIQHFGPNVLYAWHMNISAIAIGGWWIHESVPQVTNYVKSAMALINQFHVFNGDYRPNFLYIDRYGADDYSEVQKALTAKQAILYNNKNWDAILDMSKQLSEAIGKTLGVPSIPVMLWQIPAAHIPTQDEVQPVPLEEGSAPVYFFGDNRLSNGLANMATWVDADVSASLKTQQVGFTTSYGPCADKTITQCLTIDNFNWAHNSNAQLQKAVDSHVFSILWGAGGYSTSVWYSSACMFDDHGWMTNKVNDYYAHTQPLTK